MATFFTSDPHFYHKNIIKLCPDTRPYSDVEEMNEALIQNHNSVVGPNDTVYCLGDWSWSHDQTKNTEIFNRLNGAEKILIKGNHETPSALSQKWSEIHDYMEIKIADKYLVLFHYPIYEWVGFFRNSIHLFGHVHGKPQTGMKENAKFLDVGVDGVFNRPIALDEIIDYMRTRSNV